MTWPKSYAWYEDQLSGLGERFLTSIDNAFDIICTNTTAFQVLKRIIPF